MGGGAVKDRQLLRVVWICLAIVIAAGTGLARCQEVAVSVGATASSGLGEQAYSPLIRARVNAGRIEATGAFDWSRKSESGAGWIGGLDADARFGPLILGADYRHRDGGAWSKDVAFARVGIAAGPARIVYRHEAYSTATAPNRARAVEVSARHAFARGLYVEGLVAGMAYRQAGATRYGTYSQVSVGRQW